MKNVKCRMQNYGKNAAHFLLINRFSKGKPSKILHFQLEFSKAKF